MNKYAVAPALISKQHTVVQSPAKRTSTTAGIIGEVAGDHTVGNNCVLFTQHTTSAAAVINSPVGQGKARQSGAIGQVRAANPVGVLLAADYRNLWPVNAAQ